MSDEINGEPLKIDYPIDPFMEKVGVFTDKVFKEWLEKGVMFSAEGESISGNELGLLSSPIYMLPIIAVDADRFHKEMTGENLPFYLYKDQGALTYYGIAAHESMDTNTMTLWTHHIDHSIEKAIEKAHPNYKKKIGKEPMMVPLDYMLKNYDHAINNKLVETKSAPLNYKHDQLFKNTF